MITKKTSIASIIAATPQARDVMIRYGIRFIGIGVGPLDPLDKVAKASGLTDEEVDKIVNELNVFNQDSEFKMMLTNRAAEKLKEMLRFKESEAIRLKLYTEKAINMYDIDFTNSKDDSEIITHSNGVKFFIEKKSAGSLKGTTIDYDAEEDEFVFNNPNLKG